MISEAQTDFASKYRTALAILATMERFADAVPGVQSSRNYGPYEPQNVNQRLHPLALSLATLAAPTEPGAGPTSQQDNRENWYKNAMTGISYFLQSPKQ